MKKSFLYFLGGMASIFATIGLFILILYVLGIVIEHKMASDNKSQITVLAESRSPDKKHIATTFAEMGGGAAGYCYTEVNVRSSDAEFNEKESVFTSHCGTKIKIEWSNTESLHLLYSSEDKIQSMTQRAWNPDKTVRIIYEGK